MRAVFKVLIVMGGDLAAYVDDFTVNCDDILVSNLIKL